MIVTESEAKDKFCKVHPAAVVQQQGLTGPPTMAYAFTKCLGQQCAHWRWYAKGVGYCGLAGIPIKVDGDAAH